MNLQDSKKLFISLKVVDIHKKGKTVEVEIESSNESIAGERKVLFVGDTLTASLNLDIDMSY